MVFNSSELTGREALWVQEGAIAGKRHSHHSYGENQASDLQPSQRTFTHLLGETLSWPLHYRGEEACLLSSKYAHIFKGPVSPKSEEKWALRRTR